VVRTVSRPMLTKSMFSEVLRAYKADKNTRKDFENPEEGRFENLLMDYCMRWKMGNGGWSCRRARYDRP
jgi:hypothetical protein